MSAHCGKARGPRYWMAALKHALSAGERSRVPHRVPEDPSRERTHSLKSKDLHDTHHVCLPLFYPVLFSFFVPTLPLLTRAHTCAQILLR